MLEIFNLLLRGKLIASRIVRVLDLAELFAPFEKSTFRSIRGSITVVGEDMHC